MNREKHEEVGMPECRNIEITLAVARMGVTVDNH